jgi:type III secretion protein J
VRRLAAALLLALAGGCAGEEILHGLDEAQANQVLVALSDGAIRGRKAKEDGSEGGWAVAVPSGEAGRARRILAERELPRARPPGFAEVFGKGSMVPTPAEERALFHHALAGELSRSLEAIDGVVEARVHLALPTPDPLRPDTHRAPRAAVLVKCRPEARGRVESLAGGVRSLVAGAAEGLDPASVSVVIAEAGAAPPPPEERPRRPPQLLLGVAAGAGALALLLAGIALAIRMRSARSA